MKGINPYELIIEGLVFSLLLFPGFFPSPYISLAFVVVILAVLCVVSKRYPNTAMRREILQFRRIGWVFLVMLFCLLLLQSMFVLEIDRVAMQRSVVLMAQIYVSVGFFSVLSSGLINLKCVVKAASLFCILFSVYYLIHVLLNGIPDGRSSIFGAFSSNYCASILYLLFPVLFYYISKNKNNADSRKIVVRCYLALILSFFVILTTGSRTALGMCVFIFGFINLFTKWDIKKVVKLIVAAVLGIIALFILMDRVPAIQDSVIRALRVFTESDVVKSDIRSLIWQVAMEKFEEYNHWLGSGSNHFMFYDIYEPPHNFVIEILMSYGYVGLGLAALTHIVFVGRILCKRSKTKKVHILAICGAYMLTAYVQPFFSTSFNCGLSIWMTMCAIALDDTVKA